jgi:catechol-2,3-dioxygenase
MLKLDRIIEMALYVDDLERGRKFYGQVLQLDVILETETASAFNVGDQSVLLIFKRGASLVTQSFPGGPGMPHGEIPRMTAAALSICALRSRPISLASGKSD